MTYKIKLIIYITVMVILLLSLIYSLNNTKSIKKTKELTYSLFEDLQSELVDVNKYIIYGTHLNINGKLDVDLKDSKIEKVKLVLKDIEEIEIPFEINYTIDKQLIEFNTSNQINTGIYLEEIPEGQYYILLKIVVSNENVKSDKYYLLDNTTKYESLEYYTITRNNRNKKINIDSGDYLLDGIFVPYMKMTVKKQRLPKDVYDIVIDPGHGGNDCGAVKGEYFESKITLDYSIKLKNKLEELGLKVKLVRDSDVSVNTYGTNGRAVIPNEVKAKYVFSIHLNSTVETMRRGGVEVYSPPNSNLDFSKLIADNIVKIAKTTYSPNEINKVDKGVYVRNYTKAEISEVGQDADRAGYSKYRITTDTPYFFMIRETGGIATGAYIDGRNKNYGRNLYYNSNMGVEGYLLELGFMSCSSDFNNVLGSKKLYVNAITKSIQDYLNITNYKTFW